MANDLMERRRYARADIEGILGRALAIRDEKVLPSEGLPADVARQTLVELGRTLGLPEDVVMAAFAAEAEEFRLAQRWVESIGGTPSALAVVRHLARNIEQAAPEISARHSPFAWVVDPQAHQASRLVHAAEVAALGIFALGNTPQGGTVPAHQITLLRVVRPAVKWFGFQISSAHWGRVAMLRVVDLPNGIMVHGEIDDRAVAAIVGPLLAELETRLGDRFEIGKIVVNDLG